MSVLMRKVITGSDYREVMVELLVLERSKEMRVWHLTSFVFNTREYVRPKNVGFMLVSVGFDGGDDGRVTSSWWTRFWE